MFLTNILFRKGIPGKQWIGKYRRPRQITWQMKAALLKRLEVEAANEYWLSRPYMTKEQEYGHAAERSLQRWQAIKSSRLAKFPDHKYLGEHLDHLNVTKKWNMS